MRISDLGSFFKISLVSKPDPGPISITFFFFKLTKLVILFKIFLSLAKFLIQIF